MLREIELITADSCYIYKIKYFPNPDTIPSNSKVTAVTYNHSLETGYGIEVRYKKPNNDNNTFKAIVLSATKELAKY